MAILAEMPDEDEADCSSSNGSDESGYSDQNGDIDLEAELGNVISIHDIGNFFCIHFKLNE